MSTEHPIVPVLATKKFYADFILTGLSQHAEAVRSDTSWEAIVQLIALSVTAENAGRHIYSWVYKNFHFLVEAGVTKGQVRALETAAESLLELADDIQVEFNMLPDDPAVAYMLRLTGKKEDEEEFSY